MAFGKHKNNRSSALEAGSSSTARGLLQRLFSKRGGEAQPDAGSVASSAGQSGRTREEHREDGSTALMGRENSPVDQSLWNHAYNALRDKAPQTVQKYEELLNAELQMKSAY